MGPFTYASGQILARDNANGILGPGHHSILQVGSSWYICYHRQHYQYVDVKRQIAMNQITVNGNTIGKGVQTQAGIWSGTGALETLVASARAATEKDLAFGKTVAASSESDYKGGTGSGEKFAAVTHFYAAKYAVDHNNGTLWAPSSLPGNLVVDLGSDQSVGRCETTFEYVLRTYRYRIEYLAASEAASIAVAQSSTAWHLFADRSKNTQKLSPVVDATAATARYMRLTVLSADIPTATAEINTILQTDYADRVGVFEFKVFGPPAGLRKVEASRVSGPATLRTTGSLVVFPDRFRGMSKKISVYDHSGRLVHQGATRRDWMDLRLDLGLPTGNFVVTVEAAP